MIAKRSLWKCSRCGRKFANKNQAHGCTTLTVEEYLKGKNPDLLPVYFAFESAVRACGDIRVHPTRARIGFIARMTFAGAIVKRDHLEAGVMLPYRSDNAHFHKFFPNGRGGVHYFKLTAASDVDAEVRAWLAEAYRIGLQEKPPVTTQPSPPPARRKFFKRSNRKAKVYYLHWNKEELEGRSEALRRAGHEVRGHWSTAVTAKFGDYTPDVFIISLDRLPSHGRAYAGWIWEAKKRQSTPIIFAGGQPDKVNLTRQLFPNAVFCATDEVAQAIASVLQ